MTKPTFDIRIQQFHQSLSDDVRQSVEAFMKEHGADSAYAEMVHPTDEEEPEAAAVMSGLEVHASVPTEAWEKEFATLVGPDKYAEFLEAVQEAMGKFGLGGD